MIELTEQRYYTKKEVAESFGVTLPTIGKWLRAGELVPYRVGTKVYISDSDLKAFIERGRNESIKARANKRGAVPEAWKRKGGEK